MAKEESQLRELDALRHSASHMMAQAVLEIFPDGKLGIGPPIEDGFYYDFDLPRSLTPDDLEGIEARMQEIIGGDHAFEHRDVSPDEAREIFRDQPFKLELIEALEKGELGTHGEASEEPLDKVSLYTHDQFTDLCAGPHVEHTGKVPAEGIKLLSVAGAYWRGDAKNPMLQRIYGTAWPSRKELEAYVELRAEAQRRDHRVLGKELDLFSIHHEEAGAGLIVWHPKGGIIRKTIEDYWRERHLAAGYDIVFAPHLGKHTLWSTSGHLDFYKDKMYAPMDIEGVEYYAKPMNCPYHIMVYKSGLRSYRDLPMRLAELGTVYRYEPSGVLHGLLRVRGFTIDDAHIFCSPDQVEDEIRKAVDFSLDLLRGFGFEEFKLELSVRDPRTPEQYAGSDEDWEKAEAALARALDSQGLPYDPMPGEAVFYGPKIDIKIKDALGRLWQCSTIQIDFNMPARFEMEFVDTDGERRQPFMVHRALLGSLERFFGILIEHFAGAFPVWLSPVQAIVIPIADRHANYARVVASRLKEAGLRVSIDDRSERMQAKIRDAQLQKVPYMLVVGDQEVESGNVSVRLRTEEDLGAQPLEEFIARAQEAISERRDV